MEIKFIEPIGFCPGVAKAIDIVKQARINNPEAAIYVLGQLVHNIRVTEKLFKQYFANIIDGNYSYLLKHFDYFKGLEDEVYVLSAHGHEEELENKIKENVPVYYDATCSIIKNINDKLKELNIEDRKLYYLGKANHIECEVSTKILKDHGKKPIIISNLNEIDEESLKEKIFIVNQSTIYLEKELQTFLKEHPDVDIKYLDNFCPILKQRFDKIDSFLNKGYVFLVVGDKTSSNAHEIYNYIKNARFNPVFFISSYEDVPQIYKKVKVQKIAIVSATSTDPDIIDQVVAAIEKYDYPDDPDNKLFVNNKIW